MPAAAAAAQQSAGISTVPSAMGGVDYYNSLFGTPPENAIRLVNWWPDLYGCKHRNGYRVWQTGLPGAVNSIFSYHMKSGANYMYAFSGSGMYDVTSMSVAPNEVVSGLASSYWQATMFANSGGVHKIFVSGQDNPIWVHRPTGTTINYDRLTAGDGTTSGTISGFDPKNAIDIETHQRRVWFVEANSTHGWYLPPDQVYGVASIFDFGPLFKRGGFLQSLATWTVDDGTGADDLLVAFSSEGDVAVYKGIDPSTADTWSLQGVYYAGAPISGQRFHARVSGDLKFVCGQGLISMNDMLTSTRVISPQSNVEARPIQSFLSSQASLLGDLSGWDVKFIPAINMLLVNVPSVTTDGALQLAENIVNSRWTTFLGFNANCWATDYQDVPFYGTPDGMIIQGWTGTADNVTDANPAGQPITALVQQAYNYFGTPAHNKQVGLYRPNFLVSRSVTWKASISYDFEFVIPVLNMSPVPGIDPEWDEAIWDASLWAGGLHAQKDWASAEGMGFAGSLCMATRSDGEVVWVNTDFTILSGGLL